MNCNSIHKQWKCENKKRKMILFTKSSKRIEYLEVNLHKKP